MESNDQKIYEEITKITLNNINHNDSLSFYAKFIGSTQWT